MVDGGGGRCMLCAVCPALFLLMLWEDPGVDHASRCPTARAREDRGGNYVCVPVRVISVTGEFTFDTAAREKEEEGGGHMYG